MNNEQNKCKILRWLMFMVDNLVMNGVTDDTCREVAKHLGAYCADGESFDPPDVDDFFTDDFIRQQVINAVVEDLNKNDLSPGLDAIPVGMGTLLFALHEYQHRYHEADDPLLVDRLSTLESRARGCIDDVLTNSGWEDVRTYLKGAYQEAVVGRQREMVYRLVEVRRALQEWLPEFYDEIFIAGE